MPLTSRLIDLGLFGFFGLFGACGLAPSDAPAIDGDNADDNGDDADLAIACAFDDVPFSATGAVLQAVSEDACARLEREPVEVRRGTTWRATRALHSFSMTCMTSIVCRASRKHPQQTR